MKLDDLLAALVLSGAAGSAAFMLVWTEIFAPLRVWVARRQWMRLYKIMQCPYCTAVWLALAAVLIYRPVLVTVPHVPRAVSYWPLGYLTAVMFISGTAMLWVLIIRRALVK